jgi:hypothetical protein
MHVVLGDGEMSRRELSSTLEDLLEKAGEEDFWFLVQAKAEPTATDKALMEWITERGVYFEVIGDDPKSADPIYANAVEKHTVKRLAPKVVSLMEDRPAEGEGAALYALFINNDEEVEEDSWLMDVATSVAGKDFVVFAMNDGLAELGFDEGEEEEEEEAEEEAEEEEQPAPSRKAAAKKAAPKKAPADEEEEAEEEAEAEASEYTREMLGDMLLPEIKAIAEGMGLGPFPPRTRATTIIAAILGEDGEAAAEVEPVEVPEDETAEEVTVTADAMVLVIFNGTVVSRTLSIEEARELVGM